ncbi:MAG TPA: glycyl-radical enzyme activating protein [Clostridia bacterium]|nr:glycyl-radical enzyme activating protein [Clostridia bacterium]
MALITNIQRFSTHDGDGVRTTVFLKGCPLNCVWCHNPECIKPYNEILYKKTFCIQCRMCERLCANKAHVFDGMEHEYNRDKCVLCLSCAEVCPAKAIEKVASDMTADEVLHEVLKDREFFGDTGGITLSGGEPLVHEEFSIELLSKAKEAGITICVETCGHFDSEIVPALAKVADLVLFDLKDGNEERHKENTGADYQRILKNLWLLDSCNVETVLRCIMVKGVNMDKAHYEFIAEVYGCLGNARGVELIPYHAYGGSKCEQLGYSDNGRKEWVPNKEDLLEAKRYLENLGARVI